ncbi:oxidoreductase [Planotetraspora thailandica]|uniref:Oxidoreductase n=1 Tax=Planotetraspora thailandica TaxID=487172 RepID=A0A8J3XXV2_9ACTN|nr:alpha-hydroxy-acid oxidizing protein [Planotetraspora thailandica]GII57109.1 oxidoreductase [Planotetraspora thailandica]
MSVLAGYQREIYFDGLRGVLPVLPTDLGALERVAAERLEPRAFGYVAGAAGTESTARANRDAFERRRIVPRMLSGVTEPDIAVELFGEPMASPVLLGPVGVLTIMHPDGELAVARAAAGLATTMVLSTASGHPMEEVAEANAGGRRWYQLYWPKGRDLAESFLERALAAGYRTLVVTLDNHTLAWRPRDLDHSYLPFLRGVGIANYVTDPVFQKAIGHPVGEHYLRDAAMAWAAVFGDPSLTWDDLPFLRRHWDGPIVLKGILHADDARRAADAGMDGVVVSNHGGRQADGAIAALDALPAVAAAVGDRLTVLFDSGIRTGSDVIKAMALGARAVLLARPYAYGLGLAGEAGVRHVVRSLLADLSITMTVCGIPVLREVTADVLAGS